MAGDIFSKEGSPVSLETSGASTVTGSEIAASVANLDCRSAGNAAEPFGGDFELVVGFGVAPTVGVTVDLYLVPAIDGPNFAEVDSTNHKLQSTNYRGSFVVLKSQTATQRLVLEGVPLSPRLYKAYLLNNSGQTISTGWTLKAIVDRAQYS
jgi:hypothetical protein